jgi:predicted phosphodiesterase
VRRKFDVVVTGHTHWAARSEHGSRLFLNSGSCSDGKLSFLSLDTRRGDYAVNVGY